MLSCLEGIYEQFGYCRNEGVSLAMSGIEGKQHMIRMLNELRARPPREIGGLKVTSFEDLRDEQGRLGPIKGDTDAAARNVLVFRLGENARLTLRPSGTEPKAKIYAEVCSAPRPAKASNEEWRQTCRQVDEQARQLAHDFSQQSPSSTQRPGVASRGSRTGSRPG